MVIIANFGQIFFARIFLFMLYQQFRLSDILYKQRMHDIHFIPFMSNQLFYSVFLKLTLS